MLMRVNSGQIPRLTLDTPIGAVTLRHDARRTTSDASRKAVQKNTRRLLLASDAVSRRNV